MSRYNQMAASRPSFYEVDRRFVVYDAFPGNQRERTALWMVAVDGSSPPKLLLERGGRFPELSPDGTYLLVANAGNPGDRGVLVTLAVPDDAPWREHAK